MPVMALGGTTTVTLPLGLGWIRTPAAAARHPFGNRSALAGAQAPECARSDKPVTVTRVVPDAAAFRPGAGISPSPVILQPPRQRSPGMAW